MNKIKVTFYNDVSIARNIDYKKASTESSAGFAEGGIYFTSSNDITNGNPAHIVHGKNGFIYTLGSYIISNSDINTYTLTYANGNVFHMDDDTYFISDISADPFQKTLTVTKSKIALGGDFVKKINTMQVFLNNLSKNSGQEHQIQVGGKYNVWFELSNEGILELKTENMEEGTFNNYFIDNTGKRHDNISEVFIIASENVGYFYIQAPSEITSIIISTQTLGKFKNDTFKYEIKDEAKKIAKITIPDGGWDGENQNIFEFSATIKTAGNPNENIAASEDIFTFNLQRIESPFNFEEKNTTYNVSNSAYSYISLNNDNLLSYNFKPEKLNISYTSSKWLSFEETDNLLESYFVVSSYYLPSTAEKIEFDYSDVSIKGNPYYAYLTNTGQTSIQLDGAGLWRLNLYDEKSSFKTFSYCYKTIKNPTDLYKPKDSETHEFKYWYLKGDKNQTKVTSITFGDINIFKNYSCDLEALWISKDNTITISGDKYTNGKVTTSMSLGSFTLNASATITGTTFAWTVTQNNEYITIKDNEDSKPSCEFILKQWTSNTSSCIITLTATDPTNNENKITIPVEINPVSQSLTADLTSLSWDGSNNNPQSVQIFECKTSLNYTPNTKFDISLNRNTGTDNSYTVSIRPKEFGVTDEITITADESNIYSSASINISVKVDAKAVDYYWYAGWTEPSADPSSDNYIGKIINEEYPVSSTNTTTHKAGGTTNVITGYKPENPLYYYGDNRFNPGRKQYYLVLPNGIGVYGSDGANSLLDKYSLQESINIPNHKVYISNSGSSNIAGLMLY